eukprot:gene6754-2614_t
MFDILFGNCLTSSSEQKDDESIVDTSFHSDVRAKVYMYVIYNALAVIWFRNHGIAPGDDGLIKWPPLPLHEVLTDALRHNHVPWQVSRWVFKFLVTKAEGARDPRVPRNIFIELWLVILCGCPNYSVGRKLYLSAPDLPEPEFEQLDEHMHAAMHAWDTKFPSP